MNIPDQSIIDQQINSAMSLIEQELRRALEKFPGYFNNSHEAYGVLLEEVDEFWDEIKDNKREGSIQRQCNEAVQVGAMAAKFLLPYVTVSVEPDQKIEPTVKYPSPELIAIIHLVMFERFSKPTSDNYLTERRRVWENIDFIVNNCKPFVVPNVMKWRPNDFLTDDSKTSPRNCYVHTHTKEFTKPD